MNEKIDLQSVLDLERLALPKRPRVVEIRAKPYVDSLGDRELAVIVVLDEQTKPNERTWKRLQPINDAIRKALTDAGETRFPYFTFRKRSELDPGD
jgi:hypothetical protein